MDASRSVEQYKVYKQLYKGQMSMVLEAMDRRTGAHVVLKVYSKRLMESVDREQLEREMGIHSSLSHEHIVELITVFEDDLAVYLVQSFAQGGDLFAALHAAGRFDESRTAGKIIAPLLTALDHIHSKGIIHRDIKIENILLDLHGGVKLADFGLAIDCGTERPVSRLGTWEYMAPEIHLCPFKGKESESRADQAATYSYSVDCWAVGVLAYELLVGHAPFELEDGRLSYEDIMAQPLLFPDSVSHEAASFIRSALCKQARYRPSARQLLQHRWLRPYLKGDFPGSRAAAGNAAPQATPKLRDHRSLPLEVLHLPAGPTPAEADQAGVEYFRRTPVNSRARGSSGEPSEGNLSASQASLKAAVASSDAGRPGLRSAASSPAPVQLPVSPTTPLGFGEPTSSSQESGGGDARCSNAPASPRSRALQPAPPSGSLSAVAAGLFRRLPSKIQSLMNLGGRSENQVRPLLPAATSWSPGPPSAVTRGRKHEDPSAVQGSSGSAAFGKAGQRSRASSPSPSPSPSPSAAAAAAAAWTDAPGPMGMDEFRFENGCLGSASERGPVVPVSMASAAQAPKGLKAGTWSFSNLGGRRSVEHMVPHSAGTSSEPSCRDANARTPTADRPAAGMTLRSASQLPDGSGGGARRSMFADRDLAADLGCQSPAARAQERQQPTAGGRPRRGAPVCLRSVTCSDLQQQLLVSQSRLRAPSSVDLIPASPWLYQSLDVNIPGSADGDSVSTAGSYDASPPASGPLQLSPKAAALSSGFDFSASRSCSSPSPTPSGYEARPWAEAGQSMRGASRSQARRQYLEPIVQVNSF